MIKTKDYLRYYGVFAGICILLLLLGFTYLKLFTEDYIDEFYQGFFVYSNIRILLITLFAVASLKLINKANLESNDDEGKRQIVILHAISSAVCFIFMIFPIIKLIQISASAFVNSGYSFLLERELIIDFLFVIAHVASCIFCIKKIININNITVFKIFFSFFTAMFMHIGFFRHVLFLIIPTVGGNTYIDEKIWGNDLIINVLELILFFVLLISYALVVRKRTSRSGCKEAINKRNTKRITIVFAIVLLVYCIWSFGILVIKNVPAVIDLKDRIEQYNLYSEKTISNLYSDNFVYSTINDKDEIIAYIENGIITPEQEERIIASSIQTLLCQITYFVVSIAISIAFLIYFRRVLKAIQINNMED